MLKVQRFAVGAQLVGAVKHQDVLDDQTVGSAGVSVLADLVSPGGSPVNELEVFIFALDDLTPASLVKAEEDIAVLILVGGLDSGGITGDNAVIINADGKARVLGLIYEPSGALGGVGVRVNTDSVAGIVLLGGRLLCGGLALSGGGRLFSLLAAGAQSKHHCQSEKQRKVLFHFDFLLFI